jgi:A/G-specific adenine glycosylase
VQEDIPMPKASLARKPMLAVSLVLRDHRGRVLLEQRPGEGMWAGLWQVPTLERPIAEDDGACEEMVRALCASVGIGKEPARARRFVHVTTHRDVQFVVYEATWSGGSGGGRVWAAQDQMASLGMSNAQRRVLEW